MTKTKNNFKVLLIFGGGGNEHDVSIVSKTYLKKCLSNFKNIDILEVEITKDKQWVYKSTSALQNPAITAELRHSYLYTSDPVACPPIKIDYIIPCVHGFPGETGHLQAIFELQQIPFLGCGMEASNLCMNKISTKLWLQNYAIPVVPFLSLNEMSQANLSLAQIFLKKYKNIFVKASSEGSSIGVFPVHHENQLEEIIEKAFKLSKYVLLENAIKGREIEFSVYEYRGKVHVSPPGEIHCPTGFYDYDQKYAATSNTKTSVTAHEIPAELIKRMQNDAIKAFQVLKLKDLCRIDFFLENEQYFINEINTFPGMTPISLFPQMLINNGHNFSDFLYECIVKHFK